MEGEVEVEFKVEPIAEPESDIEVEVTEAISIGGTNSDDRKMA